MTTSHSSATLEPLDHKINFKDCSFSEAGSKIIVKRSELNGGPVDCVYVSGGSEGIVFKCELNGLPIAIKKFIIPGQGYTNSFMVRDYEYKIYQKVLPSPYFVKVLAADASNPVIYMEYIPLGSLKDCLDKIKFTHTQKIQIALDILNGLKILTQKEIIHNDLRPVNILIYQQNPDEYHAKICDFGVASYRRDDKEFVRLKREGDERLPDIMSPRRVKDATPDFLSDIYSFGMLLYSLFIDAKGFFSDEKVFKIPAEILNGNARKKMEALMTPLKTSATLGVVADLILRCTETDRAKRPSVDSMLDCFKGIKDPQVADKKSDTPPKGVLPNLTLIQQTKAPVKKPDASNDLAELVMKLKDFILK